MSGDVEQLAGSVDWEYRIAAITKDCKSFG